MWLLMVDLVLLIEGSKLWFIFGAIDVIQLT